MKQQNVSASDSTTFGPQPGGSFNLSASRDKIHSNFDSVQEQTGLFAGKGGYQVKVGEHTQLDGAVIASTADKDKNTLDTGTLGFGDIKNKADFKTEHHSVSISTGGSVGGMLLSNMAANTLGGANREGHAQSTTHAAVSDGTLIIRDKDNQQQDITTLSRDTDHANNALSPIFDKEKEQQRVDVVTNTLAHAILGAVAAEVSGNNALAGAAGAAGGELAARELMKHIHGENAKVSDLSEEEKQTISTLSTLAAGLAGGIAGDSTGSAVTGAQAGKNAVENNFLKAGQITSWLEKYKASSTDEEKNRLIEVASKADQDQQQKAIETKISKDYLMKQQEELIKLIQSSNCDADCTKLTEYSLNQISPVIDNYDTLQKSNNIPRAVIATISLALPTLAKTATPAVTNWIGSTTIANRAIGVGTTGLANLGMQGYNIYNNPQENFSYTSFGTSLITGGATAGMGYWGTAATNTLGAGVSSVIDGNSPWLPMGGAFVGSSVGYGVTKGTTNYLDNKMNPWSNGFKERFNLINPSISAPPLVSPAPGIVGSAVGAVGSETANKVIMDELSSKDKK